MGSYNILMHVASIMLMPLSMYPQMQAERVRPLVRGQEQRLYHTDSHTIVLPSIPALNRL
jgi:hypothetical protein